MTTALKGALFSALVWFFSASLSHAQTNSIIETNASLQTNGGFNMDDNYRPGWRDVTLGGGTMFSPIGSNHDRPVVNYIVGSLQIGYMLTDIHGDGLFRGNVELAAEGFGAAIYEETGNYIAGGTLWARYNFVPAGWRFSPYAQLGMGGTSMDIDHKYDGHNFNFNLDAAGGIRYFFHPRLSFNMELRYQHISNANTADHNIGVNALGPAAGLTWFF